MSENGKQSRQSKLSAYPDVAGNKSDSASNKKWEILLSGDFNDQHTELLNAMLEVPRHSAGTIYIDSNGGSVYTAIALSSLIRLRQLRATAIVLGECSSAALLPFATCEKRYVTPYTTHLFHPMKWESEENVRLEEAAEWTRHFQEIEQKYEQLLSKLLNFDLKQLAAWSIPGRFISGQELVEAGIAELLDPFAER